MLSSRPPSTKALKPSYGPSSLTFAFFPGCGLQGVAVEPPLAAFAVVALRVAQAFEAAPAGVVAHAQRVRVHVAVAVASLARTGRPGSSEGVTIVTVFTHLTAHPYTPPPKEKKGRKRAGIR